MMNSQRLSLLTIILLLILSLSACEIVEIPADQETEAPASPQQIAESTEVVQPTATTTPLPTASPTPEPTVTPTPEPTLFPPTDVETLVISQAELIEKWRSPLRIGLLTLGSCAMVQVSAYGEGPSKQTDEPDEFEALIAMTIFGALLHMTEEGLAAWEPTPDQLEFEQVFQETIDAVDHVLEQWINSEITGEEASNLLEAACESAGEAGFQADTTAQAEGLTEADSQMIMDEAGDEVVLMIRKLDEILRADEIASSVSGLALSETTRFVDSSDALHIVGEVYNHSDTPYELVGVIATLYDEAGATIGTDIAYTRLEVIPPNGKSPFELIIDEHTDVDHYELQVQGWPADELPRQDIEILSSQDFVDDLGVMHIVGEVENTGDGPAKFVEIVATFYNAAGTVVNTNFTFAEQDILPPDSKSTFELTIDHPDDVDHYELQVEAE